MRRVLVSVLTAVLAAACWAGPASFTSKPTVAREGDKLKISFAVSGPTDVEVAVARADGQVMRHLAAGVLGGPNPPPAPLRPGLKQELVWDGKDDLGRPIDRTKGDLRVRVRAGTAVRFGRFIGEDPFTFGAIASLAADEDGNLYIMGFGANRNQRFRTIRVFSPEGKYLRTVMPFPADLPADAMKDVARWDEGRKSFHPRNLNSLNPEFYVMSGLNLAGASARTGLALVDEGTLYRLDPRGAVAGDGLVSQAFWPRNKGLKNTGGGPVFLAASPDGKWLYLAGPFSSKTVYGHAFDANFPPGRIYRANLGPGQTMQPFADIEVDHQDGQGGTWRKHNAYYNDGVPEGPVHGLAVDTRGNLYVADRQNQRVAVFDAAGKLVGQAPVACPHQVAVDGRTGEVYVLSRYCAGYWQYKVSVSKFKGVEKGGGPTATYEFPVQKTASPQMALVSSGKKTAVYVAGVPGNLVALEDQGDRFALVETAFKPAAEALDVFNRLEVDPDREEVYVSDGGTLYARFDGLTGQGGLLKKDGRPFLASDLAVGYDGLLYLQGCRPSADFSGPLERYTRQLEPAPYPSGTHVLSKYIYGRYGIGNCEKGIGVGPDGTVYIAWMFAGWVKYAVTAWGPDGKPINGRYSDIFPGHHKDGTSAELTKAVIGPIPQTNGGVRVDLKGNIYVGMIVEPKSLPVPKGFENDQSYRHCTGSVVKFPPEGGSVPGTDDQMTGGKVDGALHTYPGLSPFSHPHLGTSCCVCRVPRFGLDRYGRLAIPNATGNFVRLVDNAGNMVLEFGRYGNFDSQYINPNAPAGASGGPTVAVPDIPLAWPNCAGITDRHIYVLDIYNRRVVRADMTCAVEESCEVK